MANCTNVGSPGKSISIADNPLPGGVIVVLSGYAQSSAGQTAQVLDSTGAVVAKISCNGNNGAVQSMGIASFTVPANPGPYTLAITNSGSQVSQVIKNYQAVSFGTTTYLGTWMFISEDNPNGGDCDFNDSTVYLSWNLKAG